MASHSTVTINRGVLVLGAIVLVAAGAGSAWLISRRSSAAPPKAEMTRVSGPAPTSAPSGEVGVTLSKEAADRVGIEVAAVASSSEATTLRIPGTVQPNAYKTVSVTPLASGRITRVLVELGQSVQRGQLLAEIYSPDLAEARTKYLSAIAELSAHELELQRTEKLVTIGAASKQELEQLHAEHTGKLAMVESYRSKLSLLGLSEQDIQNLTPQSESSSTLRIVAPDPGVVTARAANVGLNVDPSMSLFTLSDLSSLWIVGELYERDFAAAGVGTPVTVTFAAFPDLQLPGKIAYIDPQVKAETRTAQVRVEVPNAKNQLRLGMLAEIRLSSRQPSNSISIPRSAVQTLGDRTVVYVRDPNTPSRFIERQVALGEATGTDTIRVLSGLQPGEQVVAKGSFSLRAERERLGLGNAGSGPNTGAPPRSTLDPSTAANVQTARIEVTEKGFEPESVSFKPGLPARLSFVRTTEHTCGTEVVVPSLNIRRQLPLNQQVDIDFTPSAGTIDFACGMAMLKGTIVVN
jgi:membrane fusion protein, heavy metal efflux system